MMVYQEAAFYFYTGTGNSYRVTTWMAAAAEEAGATVTVRPVKGASPAEEVGRDETALLGLAMPTHGFTAPWAMLRFAMRLPRRRGVHAIVVAMRAGLKIGPVFTPGVEGTATFLCGLILALKGYRVRGAIGVDMPSNWLAVHPGLSPNAATAIVERAKGRVGRFIDRILAGGRRFAGWGNLLFGIVVLPISLAYMAIGRFFLARLFFASTDCTSCGLCARHCPNDAIEMRGPDAQQRPYWTFRCESCMRCIGFCPTRAVEANYLLGIAAYLLAMLIPMTALLAWLAARVPLLAWLAWIPRWVFEWAYILVVLALLYPLFHRLARIPWLNRLLAALTPTHYYRRYHEPDTRLGDLG